MRQREVIALAKFNQARSLGEQLAARPDATTNYEGGLAFTVDPEMELYLRVCAGLLEESFYTKPSQQLEELRELIHRCDRRYVLQLANYARNAMYLRTIPLVLLAEATREKELREPKPEVRQYVPKIIRRADEPAELVAYWLQHIGGGRKANFPNSLREGLSDAISRFDEYELAKWNRNGAVKLRDVLAVAHVKARDGGPRWTRKERRIAREKGQQPNLTEGQRLLDRAFNDQLATPSTWENIISTEGPSAASWNKAARNMGIRALLMNLANFEKHWAEEAIEIAIKTFTDPERVQKSKLFPFRWLTALEHIRGQRLRDAVITALNLSIGAIQPWPGITCIVSDNSGSMRSPISAKSKVERIEVAAVLAAMAVALSPEEYRAGVFGHDFAWVPVSRHDSIVTNAGRFRYTNVGYATFAWLALEALRTQKVRVDRVVLLSDMQCYTDRQDGNNPDLLQREWTLYRREINPKAQLYSIDLAGYGTSQFTQDDPSVHLLSGWSERVLDLVRFTEAGGDMVKQIKEQW